MEAVSYTHLAVLRNEINGVRNDADHKYESVTKKMEQEASLFSDTSINMGMQDGKLVVTMRAVPKALEKNETVTASLTAGGTVYRQALDAENQAQFMLCLLYTSIPAGSHDLSSY